MNELTINGLRNVQMINDYFASSMVDIAYIKEMGIGCVKVALENGIDIDNENDRLWLSGILQLALVACEETSATIIFHRHDEK